MSPSWSGRLFVRLAILVGVSGAILGGVWLASGGLGQAQGELVAAQRPGKPAAPPAAEQGKTAGQGAEVAKADAGKPKQEAKAGGASRAAEKSGKEAKGQPREDRVGAKKSGKGSPETAGAGKEKRSSERPERERSSSGRQQRSWFEPSPRELQMFLSGHWQRERERERERGRPEREDD